MCANVATSRLHDIIIIIYYRIQQLTYFHFFFESSFLIFAVAQQSAVYPQWVVVQKRVSLAARTHRSVAGRGRCRYGGLLFSDSQALIDVAVQLLMIDGLQQPDIALMSKYLQVFDTSISHLHDGATAQNMVGESISRINIIPLAVYSIHRSEYVWANMTFLTCKSSYRTLSGPSTRRLSILNIIFSRTNMTQLQSNWTRHQNLRHTSARSACLQMMTCSLAKMQRLRDGDDSVKVARYHPFYKRCWCLQSATIAARQCSCKPVAMNSFPKYSCVPVTRRAVKILAKVIPEGHCR